VVVHLSDDLLFSSRVAATARAKGLPATTIQRASDLPPRIQVSETRLVLVDLSFPGLRLGDLMRTLHGGDDGRPFVVAYGSHVDTETLQAARDAGCDVVLPRSKFVADLEDSLANWASSRESHSHGQGPDNRTPGSVSV
jgi:DNA-binding NarL/FixJ family response regulator